MQDRIPGAPGQYKATITTAEFQKLQAGEQFNIVMARDDQPIVEGTPYNKAAVLPDSAAAILCPDNADPTPADAFLAVFKAAAPYNLLDNSYFKNPINQRGSKLYKEGSIRYTIDRWRAMAKNTVTVIDGWVTSNGDSGTGGIRISNSSETTAMGFAQYLADEKTPAAGTTVTVACQELYGTVYAGSATMPESGSTTVLRIDDVAYVVLYAASEGARVTFMVRPGCSLAMNWALLLKGKYTADTLPDFRPKDYSAELMECMRYYQVHSTADVAAVDMRPTMRLSSPTITEVDGGYAYSADL